MCSSKFPTRGRGQCSGSSGGCGGAAEAVGGGLVVTQPVGVAFEGDDDRSVQEPVEHGGRDSGVAEDFSPGAPASGGGYDDGRFQISLGDNLKQCGGGFGGQR